MARIITLSVDIDQSTYSKTKQSLTSLQALVNSLSSKSIKLNIDVTGLQKYTKSQVDAINALAKLASAESRVKVEHEKTAQARAKARAETAKYAAETQKSSDAVKAARQKTIQSANALAATQERTEQSANRLATAEQRVALEAQKGANILTKASVATQKATAEMKYYTSATSQAGDTVGKLIGKVALWSVATTAIYAPIKAFREALETLKKVDSQLVIVRKTTNFTEKEVARLTAAAYELAEAYGRTADEVLEASVAFARAGYADQIEQLSELSVLLQNVGDLEADTANSFLLAANAAWKLNGDYDSLLAIMDGMNQVTNRNATDFEKLAEGITVSGSVFATAGETAQDFTALLGTVTAATQRSGAEVARGLRTIAMNIRQIKGEFEDDGGEITLINDESIAKASAALKEQAGILTIENGELKKTTDVLEELAAKWNSLNTIQQSVLGEALAGKRQANTLYSLMQNFDMYEKMVEEYATATGSALRENELYLDSWEAKTKQLTANWTEFTASIIDSDAIKGLIDGLSNLVTFLDDGAATFLLYFGTARLGLGIYRSLTSAIATWSVAMQANAVAMEGARQKLAEFSATAIYEAAVERINAEATGMCTFQKMAAKQQQQELNVVRQQAIATMLAEKGATIQQMIATGQLTQAEANEAIEKTTNLALTGQLSQAELTLAYSKGLVTKETILLMVATKQISAEVGAAILGTKGLDTAVKGLWATIKANPLGLILTILSVLASVIANIINDAKEARREARAAALETADAYESELKSYNALYSKIKDESKTRDEIVSTMGEQNEAYKIELGLIGDVNLAREKSIELLEKEARASAEKVVRETGSLYSDAKKALGDGVTNINSSTFGERLINSEQGRINAGELGIIGAEYAVGFRKEGTAQERYEWLGRLLSRIAKTPAVANGTLSSGAKKFLQRLEAEYTELGDSVAENQALVTAYETAQAVLAGTYKPSSSSGSVDGGDGGGSGTAATTADTVAKAVDYIKDSLGIQKDELEQSIDILERAKENTIDPITESVSSLEEEISTIKDNISDLEEILAESKKPFEAQLEALEAQNEEREEALTLAEKQLAVEKALQDLYSAQGERTVRRYNAATGQWDWVANSGNVAKAQETLDKARADLTEYESDQKLKADKAYIQVQIDALEAVYEQEIATEQKRIDNLEKEIALREEKVAALEKSYDAQIAALEEQTQAIEDNLAAINLTWSKTQNQQTGNELATAQVDAIQTALLSGDTTTLLALLGVALPTTPTGGTATTKGISYSAASLSGRKAKGELFDSGGILRGMGNIKATKADEVVLDPSLASKIISPTRNGEFTRFATALGLMFGTAQRADPALRTSSVASNTYNSGGNTYINGVKIGSDMMAQPLSSVLSTLGIYANTR